MTCERCGKPLEDCDCPRNADGAIRTPAEQQARVRREKRRGKHVTVVTGLDPAATDMAALLKEFKTSLGAGGALSGKADAPTIELQGDHADAIVAALRERGYPAKRAGG